MKLTLSREKLLKPLQMVMGVVEKKQTMPILANILLDIKDSRLSITGTDSEIELIGVSTLEQTDAKDNRLTIPGKKLFDICKALPDNAAIELYQDKGKVILHSGQSRFTLSTLPADEFPYLEAQTDEFKFTILQSKLRQLLQRTYFAMAQQDVRYYLNGMLLELYPNKARTVATDGHRLAMNTIETNIDIESKQQVIIPRKGVVELLKLLENEDIPITLSVSKNHIKLQSSEFSFTSKLIDGRFPDIERVIPKNGDKKILLDRECFKQTLSRASILCNEKFRGLRLELEPGKMKLSANNPEQEVAEEEISIVYNQELLDIGFNVNYMLDIMNTIDSEQISLTLSDASSSILVEEVNSTWDSVFVVMPMRL